MYMCTWVCHKAVVKELYVYESEWVDVPCTPHMVPGAGLGWGVAWHVPWGGMWGSGYVGMWGCGDVGRGWGGMWPGWFVGVVRGDVFKYIYE